MAISKDLARHSILAWVLLSVVACASQKPMLASNEHLMRVGPEVAKHDIDDCMARAEVTPTALPVGTPSLVLRQTLSPVPLPAVQAVRFLATPVRVPLQVRSVVLSAV